MASSSSQRSSGRMMGSFSAGGSIGYAYPLEEEDNDASMSYIDDSATLHSRATYHNPKEVYERAQQSSSNQVGSKLYNNSNNINEQPRRRPPNRALRFRNNNNVNSFRSSAQSSMQPHSAAMSSSFQSSSFNNSSSRPLTSSILSSSSSSQYYNQSTAATSTSMSGNPLHRVSIDQNEDSEVELNKDEIRQLIIDEDHAGTGYSEFYGNIIGGGASSVTLSGNGGGSTSSSFAPNNNSTSSVITPITSTSASSMTSFHTSGGIHEFIKLTQSKQFRKSFFLSILFTLMALGTFLTIENVIHVKDVNAWIEPNNGNNKNDFGIQWSMGSDAPRPIINQDRYPISSNIQDYIADWAIGTTFIPGIIDNYGSIALTDTTKFRDVPLFWGTEYADAKGVGGGSSMMEGVLGSCLNLVQVSSVVEDAADGSGGGGGLANVEVGDDGSKVGGGVGGDDYLQLSVVMNMGRKYINVDTTTKEGIARAKILALSSSGMADVIYTSLLQDASSIFTTLNQARMFVLIRHPVEREMARFRYLRREDYATTKLTEWQRGKLQDMSYEEYAKSEFARDNWMTRELVNKRCMNGKDEEGDAACALLNENDVNTAKEILRRKAVIGLYSDIIGAVQHFGRYFGWDNAQKGKNFEDATMYCFQSRILEGMRKDALGGDDLDPNDALEYSNAHATLMDKNKYDFELFTYAQTLYKYQIELS